ncbi:CSTOS protein, partial [Drymodes brunneopygia]|nr:CSTOS protein [Drymodes brunneopygia]
MAAPRGRWGPDSDSSSDSESGGEAAARFREAAWDYAAQAAAAARAEPRSGEGRRTGWALLPRCGVPSLLLPAPPVRFVSQKYPTSAQSAQTCLRSDWGFLFSFITVLKDSSGPSQSSLAQSDSEDDGFRLFSSSVPGDCGEPEPCPAARRRRPVSSSDTDSDREWQRYQEAAVSAADILKQSAFPSLSHGSSQDQSQGYVEPNQKKKKKKKIRRENNIQERIIDPAECDQICKDLPRLVSANGQKERQDSNHRENSVLPGAVEKKKKKKKKK